PRARAEGPLTLEQVVERARQNDLRVKEADAELRLLEGRYTEARWAWFPKFETTVLAGGPTPEARNNGLGGPPTNPGGFLYDLNFGDPGFTTRLEITALLPLFTFGKLRALREAGRQGVAVGKDLKSRSQNEAAYQAAQAFFGYQLARQSRQSLADTRNRLEEANTLLKKLLEQDSAQVAQSDLNKLEFYRQQAEALAPRSEAGINLALAAVRVLLSIPPGQPVELASADLKEPELELKPVDFYLALAADHRPEFSAIRHGVAAREQEVLIRQRQFFPDFGIGGLFRFAYTSNTTRQRSPFAYDPYNSLNSGVGLVARASFDVPVKLAKLEQARAELDKLKVQESLLQSGVRLEVQKIYGDLNTALLRAKALSVGERNARRWFTAAYANFELGTTDTRELTESLIALAQVSGEKLQSWHDVSLGLYALARATGTDEARGSRVPNANETLNR
ncbi:MAG TPA: TolC family protein, partial [Myxococcaceae bacterium]|nr:TolC family protein [Myxococcaceae bacterium]